MPPKFGMIAALQGDLDTSDGVGKVFFRQDSSPEALRRAAEHINRAFPEDDEVDPTNVVVITWVDLATQEPQSRDKKVSITWLCKWSKGKLVVYNLSSCFISQRNTFQLVIASLETASYAIFLYTRDGIQSTSTPAGDSSVIMHTGFSKGLIRGFLFYSQGPYYRTTTDDEASVRALPE